MVRILIDIEVAASFFRFNEKTKLSNTSGIRKA
jgi:hypothetical protein